jgi:hypothetical protein
MKVNARMALEGLGKLDPELQWVAIETATRFSREQKALGKKASLLAVAASYCPVVAEMVAERMDATLSSEQLSAEEATRIGSDALINLDPERKLEFDARVELAARFVMAAAKLRALSPELSNHYPPGYWPFGMEGGFCNPMKLQMLDEGNN